MFVLVHILHIIDRGVTVNNVIQAISWISPLRALTGLKI